MSFRPVNPQINFPEMEKELLAWWYGSGIAKKYLEKNKDSNTKFSFQDGPITANNPMGVHHAWGRTYKDLWQRYHTLKGDAGRYQNGFDCQGLWVEVEVEKELGFKSKKDIENYGVANFINKCKERVIKYSSIQTEQSKRLGNFMDWDNSYYTMSDENNYAIWNFLKVCWQRGWLYKGHDSVPWCPRCETAISQHEMLTEDYKELTHKSVFLKFPISGRKDEFLLIWTTTPWTIPANIAVAVDSKINYSLVENCWIATDAVTRVFGEKAVIAKTVPGKKLVGLRYTGPYDHLARVKDIASHKNFHVVVATDSRILPITTTDGTGLVHTAVSAGIEDFKLGKKLGLPMIPIIADNADYLSDLGDLTGQNAKKHPEIILDYLVSGGWSLRIENYTHRYPACWRCKTELVWKIADEWYIAMDIPDSSGLSLRKQMIKVAKKIKWLPAFGLERELDWLKNMHDWLISKKNRYWGLALPIYECSNCHHFEVIGGKQELEKRAIAGWSEFLGNSPHKPWVDNVKILCSNCKNQVSRIEDVGNVWLDAGIVPFSTLPAGWFPADFITESFPGQFKNWFYSMIAMSTVLSKTNPFKTVLGYASLLAEDGRPMHKSWGNSIEFNEGADKIGSDVMRWMFVTHNPNDNMLFGYKLADETRRKFHLILWNVYNFFVTYANIDGYSPKQITSRQALTSLDRWILARLNQTVLNTTTALNKFDPYTSSKSIEELVSDLSLWYVRRSRDRVGPSAENMKDKMVCFDTLYSVLVTLSKLLAPFTPFISEEIFKNISQLESVHLSSWPVAKKITKGDKLIIEQMKLVRKITEAGLSQRKSLNLKVRQPLSEITIKAPWSLEDHDLLELILDELNVKNIHWTKAEEFSVQFNSELTPELVEEGKTRDLIRDIQELRKSMGAKTDQFVSISSPYLPQNSKLIDYLKRHTLAKNIKPGDTLALDLL